MIMDDEGAGGLNMETGRKYNDEVESKSHEKKGSSSQSDSEGVGSDAETLCHCKTKGRD